MTERDLGKALLNLDAAPPAGPAPRPMTEKVLARDRRRIRLLAGLAALFWVLTTAGVVAFCPFYVLQVAPRLRAYHEGRKQLQDDWDAWAMVGEWAAYLSLACVVSLLLAAVCTLLLVLFSRRATLRQINARLAEISEQLRQLRDAPPRAAGTAG